MATILLQVWFQNSRARQKKHQTSTSLSSTTSSSTSSTSSTMLSTMAGSTFNHCAPLHLAQGSSGGILHTPKAPAVYGEEGLSKLGKMIVAPSPPLGFHHQLLPAVHHRCHVGDDENHRGLMTTRDGDENEENLNDESRNSDHHSRFEFHQHHHHNPILPHNHHRHLLLQEHGRHLVTNFHNPTGLDDHYHHHHQSDYHLRYHMEVSPFPFQHLYGNHPLDNPSILQSDVGDDGDHLIYEIISDGSVDRSR